MSDVDKRVVQMDFDNKKFEKNVKQSTESLNTLKSSLNFDGVSESIDQVTVKFSKMEVVIASVISNITNRVINLGIQIIKSLSIDNISDGWAKFGQKTTSVATLMAQTLKVSGKELTDSVEKLATVNKLMNQLMWFADETSYSFTDMIDNIGKFTAAGLDLDVSTKAMEGIATWAALSGQNASTAARAMYQLSQAMGKGKIQLIDWKSIQNANMDTAEMRQNVLETAVAMGKLTKEGDKYVTKTGKKFTQNQFTEELSEGWFTSDVLTGTLEKYSRATDEIYAIAQKEGLTASEVLAKYGDTLDEFGVKAFKAAQEARTLSDALASVKDAVASKWMTTSELIFGDKDEAVQLWTDLANALYEVFAESGDFRNSILEIWKVLGGREDLFKRGGDDQGAFWNIFDAIVEVKKVIKQAWKTIFPISQMEEDSDKAQEIGNSIKQLTSRFKEWTKTLKLSEVNALRLRKVLEGAFTILKGLFNVLKAIKYIAEPIVDLVKKLIASGLDKIIEIVGKFNITGEGFVLVTNKIHDGLEKALEVITDFVKKYASIEKIKSAFARLRQEFTKLIPIIDKIKSSFISFGEKVKSIATTVVDAIKEFLNVGNGKNVDAQVVKPIRKSMAKFSSVAADVTETTSNGASSSKSGLLWSLVDLFKSMYELLVSIVSLTSAIIFLISRGIKNLAEILKELAEGAKVVAGVTEVTQGTANNLEDWRRYLEGWQGTLLIIATISVAILAMVLVIRGIYYSIQSVMAPIQTVCDSLAGYLDKLGMSSMLDSFGTMILKVAAALLVIANIDPSRLWPAVGVLAIITAIFTGITILVGQLLKRTQATSNVIMEVRDSSRSIRDSITGCFDEIKDSIAEAKNLLKIQTLARMLNAFSSAMMQTAMALYIIGQIDTDHILAGIGVMAALTLMVLGLSQYSKVCETKVKEAMPGLLQMVAFATVAKSIGKTMLMFKDISWDQMAVIGTATAAMYIFMNFCLAFLAAAAGIAKISDPKEMAKTMNNLYAISLLVFSFAVSAKILASIGWETLGVTLAIIGGFISEFAGLILLIATANKISNKEMTAAMQDMLAMSLLLFSFAISTKILSTVGWASMGVMLGIIGAFFIEFAGMITLLNLAGQLAGEKSSQEAVPILLSMSLGLFSFATSVKILSTIDWATLGVTLGVIGAFFAEFAGMIALISLASKLAGDKSDISKCSSLILAMSSLLIAFGIMAKMTAGIDYGHLWSAVGGLAVVMIAMGTLFAAIGLASHLGTSAKEGMGLIISLSGMMIAFAASVALLTLLDTGKMFASIGALALTIGLFVGLAASLATVPGALEAAVSAADALFRFSYSLAIVAGAIAILAIMPINKMYASAGALALMIGAFAGIAATLGATPGAYDAAVGAADALFKFSYSLAIVAGSIMVLAIMPINRMYGAMGALALTMGVFAGIAVTLGKVSGALTAAVDSAKALRKFAVSIAIVSVSLFVLAIQPWNKLLAAAGAIALTIGSFVGLAVTFAALDQAGKKAADAAKALGIFGLALIPLSASLAIVASQPWQGILSAALAIVAVVSTLVGAVTLMEIFGIGGQEFLTKMTAVSLGLLIFAGALALFAQAFRAFDTIDWMSLLKGLTAMAGGIIILGVAAALTKSIIPAILALAAAFLIIGLGMILAATAIQMVISTLTTLSTMSEEQLTAVSTAMNTFMSILGNSFGPLITGLINSLREALPAILALANEAVLGICQLLETQLPVISDLVVSTIATIAADLAEKSSEIFDSISTLITNLLAMIKANASGWAQDVMDILIEVLKVLSKKENVNSIVKEFLTFITNFIDSLVANRDMIDKLFNGLMDLAKILIEDLTKAAIELAGMLGKVLIIVTAFAIRVLIAGLGALSKLFLTLVSSVLLILVYTISGLTNVILEVFKVIVKELLTALVEAIIWAQDVLQSIGILIMQLIARGLISVIQSTLGWLFGIIDKIFGTSIEASLQEAQDDLATMARNTVSGIEAGTDRVQAAIKKTANNINGVVKMASEEANDAVWDGINQINDTVKDSTEQLSYAVGKNVGDGLSDGINDSTSKAEEAGENLADASIDGTKNEAEVHSPSRVFYRLGEYMVQGLANGVSDSTYVATDGMTTMVSEALTAAQNTLDSQNGDDLTIKVGMDISGVEEQSRNISSIMSGINNVNATAYGKNASYNSAAMNKGASAGTVNSTDNSTTVTYNNVINVSSTDPERSADEIDRALQRQATMAKLAHGAV